MPTPISEKDLQMTFSNFIEHSSPARLNRGLRNLLLLLLEHEDGMLPDGLKDLPMDMSRLFELLDMMEVYKAHMLHGMAYT